MNLPIVYKNFKQKKAYIEYNQDLQWGLNCDYADSAFRKASEAKEKIVFWIEGPLPSSANKMHPENLAKIFINVA